MLGNRLGLRRTRAGVAGQGRKSVHAPSQQHSDENIMKVLSIPSSGKIGMVVAFRSRFGQCQRAYTIPNPRATLARSFMRGLFGHVSHGWGPRLSQAQRDRWNLAGPQVMSHPRLSQRGRLRASNSGRASTVSEAASGCRLSSNLPRPLTLARP